MTSIITIASSDVIANSRADLNTNFSNLNSGKIETSVIDTDGTLAANLDTNIPSQKAVKTYVDAGGNVNASTSARGIVEEATASEVQTETAVGGTGARLFLNPSTANLGNHLMYFSVANLAATTNNVFSDSFGFFAGATTTIYADIPSYGLQTRDFTIEWAAVDAIGSILLVGAYIYVLGWDAGLTTNRVYRFDKTNLAGGGTLMTTVTQALGTTAQIKGMVADPSGNFYFANQAGGSASNHIISKYSVSGTVMTFVSNTTCGSTSAFFTSFALVDTAGNFYAASNAFIIRKYNSSGTLQWTSGTYQSTAALAYVIDNNKLFLGASTGLYSRVYYQ